MKKAFAVVAAAALSFIAVSAVAGPAGATLSADGRTTTVAPSGKIFKAPIRVEKTVIYSNFNSDDENLYDCCGGWTVAAIGAGLGFEQAVAMPFTPSANTTLKKVNLAIGLVTGLNLVKVAIHEDAGGIPGAVIQKLKKVTTMPTFGTCCVIETVKGKGLALTGGTTYWVSATATSDTWAAWNFNNTGAQGAFAFDSGSGWQATSGQLGAYEVIGE